MPAQAFVKIRHAARQDVDALVVLEEATFASDRLRRRQWRHHIDSPTASVLINGSAGVLRGAAVVLYRRNAHHARLYSLAVRTGQRGTGLGSALLAAAEADARRHGCTAMHLEARCDNAAAIALYARHGYLRTARVPRYYEDGADAWRYAKALVAAAT